MRWSNAVGDVFRVITLAMAAVLTACVGGGPLFSNAIPAAVVNLCDDSRIPKGISCKELVLPSFISNNVGVAKVAEVHLGMRMQYDYSVPVDEAFALLPDQTFVKVPVRRDFAALLQINQELLPNNPVGSARKWLPDFWTVQLDGSSIRPCLSYSLAFPFSGKLSYCVDGKISSSLGYADGAVSMKRALELSARALMEKGLSVDNAEHLENRNPTRIAVDKRNDRLEYEITFDGRRRTPPYKQYIIRIPVTEEQWSITEVPWPSNAF